MLELGEPLGWDISYLNNPNKQIAFIEKMDFPSYNNYTLYAFNDILENLALL